MQSKLSNPWALTSAVSGVLLRCSQCSQDKVSLALLSSEGVNGSSEGVNSSALRVLLRCSHCSQDKAKVQS